jgi:hypothetical protein
MRSHQPHVSFGADRITAPPLHWFETNSANLPEQVDSTRTFAPHRLLGAK